MSTPRPRLLAVLVAWLAMTAMTPAVRGDPPAADPAPPTDQLCKVTILSAPERIRVEINQWVEAEHRCSRTLELRVEPGEGGLHVFARDDHGRVRERVVPDDQSLGALIVSWIADDAPAPPPAVALAAPIVPPLPPEPPPAPLAFAPTGVLGVPLLAPEAELAASVPRPPTQAWWMLSGAISLSEHRKFGVRAERDLASHGNWLLDVALSQLENSQESLAISMTTATAFAALEATRGDWQFRAQAGVGLRMFWLRNYCDCEQLGVASRDSRYVLRPVTEAAGLIGHSLGTQWSFAGGAILTIGTIGFDVPQQDRVSVMMFAGVRNRL